MPDDAKAPYVMLNHLQHQQIDTECRAIEQLIFAARPGLREYTGASPLELLPGTDEDKTNPLFW
jgi:hypothetical protein